MDPIFLEHMGDFFATMYRELLLCLGIVVLILCNLFKFNRAAFFVAIVAILLHIYGVVMLENVWIFKVTMYLSALVTIIISGRQQRSEFYVLVLSILLGADLLIESNDFIMMVLSIELISISSYILTAGFHADKKRAEAAWKFFIYGSVATAFMIFGMTYVYGASGSLFPGHLGDENLLSSLGTIMVLAGFLFKMTAAPFHLWAPDVYEATPSPIVAFLSVVPKIAATWVIAQMELIFTMGAFAILTIIVGTIAAINQSNAKRMMAYSSVAQAGILLAGATFARHFIDYYIVVFAIMNYVVFIVIDAQEKNELSTNFKDFTGLGYTNPLLAVAITVGLVSLTGLPPTGGFMGKLLIFKSVWERYMSFQNPTLLAPFSPTLLALFVIGLLATAVSLYFYLKIPFYAFFRRDTEKQPLKIPLFTNLLLLILVGLLLALFIAPGLLMG